ncbi:hypothetical protein ABT56_07515 [Photobacterium aquae]|uniref:ADP-ribosylglycohydrolase n=2 Tax=Photobacterium aquae TaxID=1195763 RepID=A0A0J1JXK0_9GAMM|nr:hypothetical protein ABT56_07515 [Photobacterium aquae]
MLLAGRGALLGLACGDALGTTLEFKPKDSYSPLTDIVGGGPFGLNPGEWTDDTAMMLCLADSLIEKGGNDLKDQLERYTRWYQHGENSCTGRCFDIGNTVRNALVRHQVTGKAYSGVTDEYSAGNGSLMRIAPLALFYRDQCVSVAMEAAAESSRTTHGESRCVQACELMTMLIHRLLNTTDEQSPQMFLAHALADYFALRPDCHSDICYIAQGSYIDKTRDGIHGSGFVVASLEAALWCFAHSTSFEQGALLAANLGEDADTTAAIYGQLAGAYYGGAAIPVHWRQKLAWRHHIEDIALWLMRRPKRAHIKGFISEVKRQIDLGDVGRVNIYGLVYHYDLMIDQINYDEIFASKPWYDDLPPSVWFADATMRQSLCWLISLVRRERFMDGLIEDSVANGAVSACLDRLEELVA